MSVTAANQTFFCGILPVLLNVPVSFDSANTSLNTGDTEVQAYIEFNWMNEKLRFMGLDAIKTKDGTENVDCNFSVTASDIELVAPSFSGTEVANLSRNLDLLGEKLIAGLPTSSVGATNICKPMAFRNFGLTMTLRSTNDDPVTDANSSCLVNMKFVPEKSVVKITA
jgi:hypothetical protein